MCWYDGVLLGSVRTAKGSCSLACYARGRRVETAFASGTGTHGGVSHVQSLRALTREVQTRDWECLLVFPYIPATISDAYYGTMPISGTTAAVFGQPLTPLLTTLASGPRDGKPQFLGSCSRMPEFSNGSEINDRPAMPINLEHGY